MVVLVGLSSATIVDRPPRPGKRRPMKYTDGALHLGPWEHIFYYEFDGMRRKRLLVKILGE